MQTRLFCFCILLFSISKWLRSVGSVVARVFRIRIGPGGNEAASHSAFPHVTLSELQILHLENKDHNWEL